MTALIDPLIKEQNKIERKKKVIEDQIKRRTKLEKLIKKHGSPKKAAEALGITPQSIYEQMDRVGLSRQLEKPLPGEPKPYMKRRKWYKKLLEKHTVPKIAEKLDCGVTTIRTRLKKLRIKLS